MSVGLASGVGSAWVTALSAFFGLLLGLAVAYVLQRSRAEAGATDLKGERSKALLRLDMALSVAKAGWWEWDVAADRLIFDESWAKRLGYDVTELAPTSKTWEELVHPEDLPRARAGLAAHMEGRSDRYQAERRLRTRDGDWLWSLDTGRVVERDESGAALWVVGVELDIHEARRAQTESEEELRKARDRAQASNRAKSSFLANMSHELRTPLNAILGFSELLEQEHFGPLSPRQRTYVETILDSGQHLLLLVNDILDLSKVEAGKMTLSRERASIESLAESVLSVLSHQAQRGELRVDVCVEPQADEVFVDPLRFRQVLYNLLSNAIKFTPPGGEVHLRAFKDLSGVRVSVSDTGIGIAEEDMGRLFVEFEQVGNMANRPAGTGLGLALTQRLVSLHGGELEVESELGRGTTCTVTLPAGPRRLQAWLKGDAPSDVLIVESDPRSALLVAGELRSVGLSVHFADTSAAALEAAAEGRPRLITLDPLFAGDGWTLLERLKSDPVTTRIPIVAITISGEVERGRLLGASEFLTKPCDRDSLLQAVASVGVRLLRLDGVRIHLAGQLSEFAQALAGELRRAGCVVLGDEEEAASAEVAVVVREAPKAPGRACADESLPTLVLAEPTDEWAAKLGAKATAQFLSIDDAQREPALVVQTIYELTKVAWEGAFSAGLARRLEAEPKSPLVLVSALLEVPVSASLVEAIRDHYRSTDVVGKLRDRRIAVVVPGSQPGDAERSEGRLRVLLEAAGEQITSISTARFPGDGQDARQLLRKLSRGAS